MAQSAAPQTTKRSGVLTDHAESPPRDSSRRRKRRPASRGRCPSLITSVTPQKDAKGIHVPLRTRRFHWISAPGLLPLASQCNHGSRPRMREPHTQFRANLCTRFAKFVAPFVCRDSRKLFTLWSDATSPTSVTVVKPSRLPADEITFLGTDDVVRGKRWDH